MEVQKHEKDLLQMTSARPPRPPRAAQLALRMLRQLPLRQRLYLVLAGTAMLLAAFLTSVVPVVVGELVNRVVAEPKTVHVALVTGLITVAGVLLTTQLLQVVRRQLVESVATSYERDTRERAYKHVLLQDLSYVQQGKIGGIYVSSRKSSGRRACR